MLNPFKKKKKAHAIEGEDNPFSLHPSHAINDEKAVAQITPRLDMEYGVTPVTTAGLVPDTKQGLRSRQQIYSKWATMDADPVVSIAISSQVTAALGGHESTGQIVFIEPTAEARKNKKLAQIVDDAAKQLSDLLNAAAHLLGCTASSFGDAYVRVYSDKTGVGGLYTDELVRPPLVQPYERGGQTVGYVVHNGEKSWQRLDALQMARVKMPRTRWVPQHGIYQKANKYDLSIDEIDKLPIVPASVGGSLLFNAEPAYDKFIASLLGMTSQRIVDSIRESVFALNMEGMTRDQQDRYISNFTEMMLKSQEVARRMLEKGEFHAGQIVHAIPVWGEKQLLGQAQELYAPRTTSGAIEDVMFNVKLLAGSLGADISQLGFADILSGGLGEGVGYRVSVQSAERARMIRPALSDCFDQIINIHFLKKHGIAFSPQNKPWTINYYSVNSALEGERQRTRTDAMTSGMTLVQAMQSLKELGAKPSIVETFLSKTMLVDEDLSKEYATLMDAEPPTPDGLEMPAENEGEDAALEEDEEL